MHIYAYATSVMVFYCCKLIVCVFHSQILQEVDRYLSRSGPRPACRGSDALCHGERKVGLLPELSLGA